MAHLAREDSLDADELILPPSDQHESADSFELDTVTEEAGGIESLPEVSRLARDLGRLATIGIDQAGGISRLSFTPAEREGHAALAEWMSQAGLRVWTDAFGNTYGERPGRSLRLPAIALGSHLDSVPHGGQFDGAVGVVGALEVIRLLDSAGIRTHHPLRVVAFAGEEAARFGLGCLGSRAATGLLTPRDTERLRDAQGRTLTEAMHEVSLEPARLTECHWRADEVAAFLELHIEQGRILEAEGHPIGVVETVAGNTRVRLDLRGRADHAGATPMSQRHDALAAAAEIVLAAEAAANDPRRRPTVATIGHLVVHPNAITTVPGQTTMYLDVRDIDGDRQRATAEEVLQAAIQAARSRGVQLGYDVTADVSPTVLPMWLRGITSRVCQDLGMDHRVMPSGAGHDAAIVARVLPAGMIFVPSRDGASHCPEEWTSLAHIAQGVRVLSRSVLDLDRFLLDQADN